MNLQQLQNKARNLTFNDEGFNQAQIILEQAIQQVLDLPDFPDKRLAFKLLESARFGQLVNVMLLYDTGSKEEASVEFSSITNTIDAVLTIVNKEVANWPEQSAG